MAVVTTYAQLTLLEVAKRTNNKELLTIAEILNNINEVVQDIPWKMANGMTSHRDVRRASLPTGTFRRLNKGIAKEASQTTPIEEPVAILEAESQSDKVLVEMSADPQGVRMQEATAFIEGMMQNIINKLFYGDGGANPEQFTGLHVRQGTLQTGEKRTVIGAGGTGSDLMSIDVVQWGPDKVWGAFPKGGNVAGIKHTDHGLQIVQDGDGNDFRAFIDWFEIAMGLVVKDPRCIGRIANIESTGTSNIFNEDLLIELLNNMFMGGRGATIYVNRTLKTQAEIALKDKNNVNWTVDAGLGGVPLLHFRGHPVRLVDELTITEDAIT